MEIRNATKILFNAAYVVPYPTAPQGSILKTVADLDFVIFFIFFKTYNFVTDPRGRRL